MLREELLKEYLEYEAQDFERTMNNLEITNPMLHKFLVFTLEKARKYDELMKEKQDGEV